MEILQNNLLNWTNKKILIDKSQEAIEEQMKATLNNLQNLIDQEIYSNHLEILLLLLEIIEKYAKSEVNKEILKKIKSIILNLALKDQYLYLRSFKDRENNSFNGELASKVSEVIIQHKSQKKKPMVVKTYAPKFYEKGNSRYT
jgi:hypothetical protein